MSSDAPDPTLAGPGDDATLSEDEKALAQALGRRLADLARRLAD